MGLRLSTSFGDFPGLEMRVMMILKYIGNHTVKSEAFRIFGLSVNHCEREGF